MYAHTETYRFQWNLRECEELGTWLKLRCVLSAETWHRDCPNSGAADHDKWVIGSGNTLICYCTINHNLSIWSFILYGCRVYWCSSNLKLLTSVLWDVFTYGANLPCILFLWVWPVAACCSQWDWQKVRKMGSSKKCRRHHWSEPCDPAKVYWRAVVRQYSACINFRELHRNP